jgi:hemoglobin-like flavoprotein
MALDVDCLAQSFAHVRTREAEFTAAFYNRLFTEHPEVQALFQPGQMEQQRAKLFKSLVLVIDNLHNPEVLSSSLKGLGTRHVKYGVLPHHYPIVGSVLLKTFGQLLGSAWTADIEQAWIEAYQAVTQLMLTGADYPPDVLAVSTEGG